MLSVPSPLSRDRRVKIINKRAARRPIVLVKVIRAIVFRPLVVTAVLLTPSLAARAASKPLINYFKPMPIVGKLSTAVWGASAVGPRDPANGLEDNGASGGVGPGKETNFYWDGKIVKGEDGKYHLYASHWNHSIGFGPPSGGSTGWMTSIPMQAVADNVMGPYVSQGNCYAKNQAGNDMGHNVTALVTPTGTTPYTLSVGEIVPGQMFSSSSANGPWTLIGLLQTSANGHNNCGTLSSNFTFTVGPNGRFWATSRGGCVMDGANVLGPYTVETNSILPNLENNDNGNAEDEVIWYSGGYFHIVYNYWDHQRAYHIMSKDGTTGWSSTGLAYQGTQSPANASSSWLRYTDGTLNTWHNMERPGVYQENGHVTHFTFAVTDTDKNSSAVNSGGSKILVVPFDGVQFDCDNGDAASCAEVGGAGGAGGGGAGGNSGGHGGGGGAAGGGAAGGGRGGSGGRGGAAGVGGAGSGAAGIGGQLDGGQDGRAGADGVAGTRAGGDVGIAGTTGTAGAAGNSAGQRGGMSGGGSGGDATSGTAGLTGVAGTNGRGGASGSVGLSPSERGGCTCDVGRGGGGRSSALPLLLAGIAGAIGRRRRGRARHSDRDRPPGSMRRQP
jgi:hypothetical protein